MNLLNLAGDGDEASLVELLERQTQAQFADINRRIPPRLRAVLSADDVLQQTCVDVLQAFARAKLENEQAFAAWFRQIARRNVIDAVRSLNARKRGGDRVSIPQNDPERSLATLLGSLLITSETASRHHQQQESLERLQAAIARLPEHYRQVVQSYDLEQQSAESVASILGRSVGAVFMIRSRAHRMLATLVGSSSL